MFTVIGSANYIFIEALKGDMEIINDLQTQVMSYYDALVILLPKLVVAIAVTFIFLRLVNFIRKRTMRFMMGRADDKLLLNFVASIFQILTIVLAIILFLYIVGMGGVASSLLGAAGVSAFVIGFALKDIGENFLAGVIMAFDRPFRLGDTVKTGEVEGKIVEMSLRDTRIKTFDGKDVYVPNGQIIKNPLYNYTIDGFMRGNFTVGVDYDADIEAVRALIMEQLYIVDGVLKEDRLPRTHVKNLNTSTVDIEVHYWINTEDTKTSGLEIKSVIQTKIVAALSNANIGMPADIVELKNYNKELSVKQLQE